MGSLEVVHGVTEELQDAILPGDERPIDNIQLVWKAFEEEMKKRPSPVAKVNPMVAIASPPVKKDKFDLNDGTWRGFRLCWSSSWDGRNCWEFSAAEAKTALAIMEERSVRKGVEYIFLLGWRDDSWFGIVKDDPFGRRPSDEIVLKDAA